jgi:hypothetical protein
VRTGRKSVNGGEREIRLGVTQLGAYVLTHFGALVCGCVSGQSQEGRITNCELTVQTAVCSAVQPGGLERLYTLGARACILGWRA